MDNLLSTRIREQRAGMQPDEVIAGELFAAACEKVIKQAENFFDPEAGTVGIEVEATVVDATLMPVSEDRRNALIARLNDISAANGNVWGFAHELGAAQIEGNQLHILQPGFAPNELLTIFRNLEALIIDGIDEETGVLMMGIHPLAELHGAERTKSDKFDRVPGHHMQFRTDESRVLASTLGLDQEPDATAVSLSNALQINLSVESAGKAVEITNRMLQIAPSLIAMTGNSRFLEGDDSGWEDPRSLIWNKTHTTVHGQRVLLPEGFFGSLEDVFTHMGKFPLILNPQTEESAFGMATGMNWLAAKLKVLTDGPEFEIQKILVEFRPLSIQATAEENAAAVMLSLGRLFWSEMHDEPLMDFELVRENTMTAMSAGLTGEFHFQEWTEEEGWINGTVSGETLRTIEIERAIEALVAKGHGTEQEIRSFFENNLPCESGSRRLSREIRRLEESDDFLHIPKRDILLHVVGNSAALKTAIR